MRFPGLFVADTTPHVDDLLTAVIRAAGTAEFLPPSEIVREHVAYSFKLRRDVPLHVNRLLRS
jgi:hypothetical protein